MTRQMPGEAGPTEEAVATLRGPTVTINAPLFVRILAVVGMAALVGTAALLLIGGAHHNAQIARLQHDGVPVRITVTKCIGVAAGSGSTPASFTCQGSFVLSGDRYNEFIGGQTTELNAGSALAGVAVPGDPALVSTASSVATSHTSFSVFILPIVLLAVFILLVGLLVVRRRSGTVHSGL